jgi:mannose-6-phosphate isomerase-like protein (cupin superfamily)
VLAPSPIAPPSPRQSCGVRLVIETVGRSAHPLLQLRPSEDTLLRVVAGAVELVAGEARSRLELGDEVVVPAGTPYRLAQAGLPEARVIQQFRPAR